jgi:hypothetical protein
MTYDQGSEMALHETLSAQLKMDIFFCDPHSPWQRGSNENANGLVREYLPKGMDLSRVTHQQLTAIAAFTQQPPAQDPQLPFPAPSVLRTDCGLHPRRRASRLKPPYRLLGHRVGYCTVARSIRKWSERVVSKTVKH